MAILDQTKISEILEASRDQEIIEAITHENRLRMHTEPTINIPNNFAFTRWLENMPRNILPDEKYTTFQSLLTYPLPSVELSDQIFNELFKVHFAINRVIDVDMEDELREDFKDYLKLIGEPSFYTQQGWKIFQNQINSVIVIDLPRLEVDEETGGFISDTEFPEPFFFSLDTDRIISIRNNVHGDLEYIFFEEFPTPFEIENGIIEIGILIDGFAYRRYTRGQQSTDWTLDLEAPHDLGFTPARQFWSSPLGNSRFQKMNPLSANLGALDWFLFSIIEKRHLDLYAGFPVVTVWEEQCTYEETRGDQVFNCENQWLWTTSASGVNKGNRVQTDRACPVCNSGKSLVGPGTVITAPAPTTKEDNVGMPALTITEGDVASLEYMSDELKKQAEIIMTKTIGQGMEPINRQAMNRDQVKSGFESRQTVLENLATNFENIQKFIMDTVGLLRYGERYQDSIVDWGDMFFLMTGSELQEVYKDDRENAMPFFEQGRDRDQIYNKRYSNNPEQIERNEVFKQLEPLQDLSLEEITDNKDVISKRQRMLKLNFNSFIEKFERENGPISGFLPDIDFEARVEAIKLEIDTFLDDLEKEVGEPEPGPAPVVMPPGTTNPFVKQILNDGSGE